MSHIFLIGYNTMMHARFLMLILRSTNLPTHFYASTLWWTYYFHEKLLSAFTYFNIHEKSLVSFMQTMESKLSYYLIFLKYAFIWYLIRQFKLSIFICYHELTIVFQRHDRKWIYMVYMLKPCNQYSMFDQNAALISK